MKRFALAFLALPAAAALCAWIANAAASPQRRLSWRLVQNRPADEAPPAKPAPPSKAPPLPLTSPPRKPLPRKESLTSTPLPSSTTGERTRARFPWNPAQLEHPISSEEAFEAFNLGVLFFDARRSGDFQAGHVKGALSAPVWESDLQDRLARIASRPSFQPRAVRLGMPVVVYCSGGTCEDSHLLAQELISLGFGNLLIYEGGFPDWMAQGRPVDQGSGNP